MMWKTPEHEDSAVETGRAGKWWLAAILAFVVSIGVLALIVSTQRDGLAAAVLFIWSSFIGALVCVVFATISFARRERRRGWALIPAVPCAVVLVWQLSALARQQYRKWQSAQEFKVYQACIAQLKADPEIALREHWSAERTTTQSKAFFDAVWAPYVHFSANQVERIYADLPAFREIVFKQEACTPEFISAHFQEALDLARKNSTHMLENIVHHPNTPLQLIQRVVFYRKQLPFEPPYQAGLILQLRKSDVLPDPRETLNTYERNADGKVFVLTMLGLSSRVPDNGGIHRIPDQVASYVPGVPPGIDLLQLGVDELIFLPGLYNEYGASERQQLQFAEAFALEHNQRVFQKKSGQRSSL